jgi:hypothetical protein
MIRDANWPIDTLRKMTLATGTTLGRYQIKSVPGAGGRGEVSADGQRFLINHVVDGGNKQPLTLVLNRASGLKQ